MFQCISAAAVVIFLGYAPAHAQLSTLYPIEQPAIMMRDALAHPYGRALMAEFAKAVTRSADAACLQSKGFDEAKLRERGRELFQRYGTKRLEILINNVDIQRFEALLAERAGPNAAVEIKRLGADPDVKRYDILSSSGRPGSPKSSIRQWRHSTVIFCSLESS